MAIVTLAKALNLKNRVVGEKGRLYSLLQANNSRREDAKTNYDPKDIFEQYEAACDKLVAIKTALAKANVGIYEKITRIAELQSRISELRGIDTNEKDDQQSRYNHKTSEHELIVTKRVVFLKDVHIDQKVKAFEVEIEKLQDEVTAYNYKTDIEVPA